MSKIHSHDEEGGLIGWRDGLIPQLAARTRLGLHRRYHAAAGNPGKKRDTPQRRKGRSADAGMLDNSLFRLSWPGSVSVCLYGCLFLFLFLFLLFHALDTSILSRTLFFF